MWSMFGLQTFCSLDTLRRYFKRPGEHQGQRKPEEREYHHECEGPCWQVQRGYHDVGCLSDDKCYSCIHSGNAENSASLQF